MLRVVFIGSRNRSNEILVDWLSRRACLVGVAWTQATAWQRTWSGRWRFAKRRIRRYGILKAVDEALFFVWYYLFFYARDEAELRTHVFEPYRAEHGPFNWSGDSIFFSEDVNSPEVVEFVKSHRPDICLAMCTPSYFKDEIRNIPKYGTFVWHEGITPEYKGLYSSFWAMYNLDFKRLGYTLLKMNDRLDAGDIYVQGSVSNIDLLRHHHNYIGHKAVVDSRPAVEAFLGDLERGVAQPIQRENAGSRYFTYPGFTDYLVQRWRLWRFVYRIRRLPADAPTDAGKSTP